MKVFGILKHLFQKGFEPPEANSVLFSKSGGFTE